MMNYEIVNRVPVAKDQMSVVVRITPDMPLNGFHGAEIQFVVNPKTIKKDVLERVMWKVNQEINIKGAALGAEQFAERGTL